MSPIPAEDRRTLSPAEVAAESLEDWQLRSDQLVARYSTGNFARGLGLVNDIGAAAEAADHHPDIDLRYGHVVVCLSSHDVGGITARDVRLARRISELAAATGVPAERVDEEHGDG
jgi:4a-hydroxytetrahydrobiopterin dehydratase